MNENQQGIIKLAIDLAKGRQIVEGTKVFSAQDSNETLRKSLADLTEFTVGMSDKDARRAFRKHKVEIFEILEEVINETIHEGLSNQFDQFAEYRNLAWGDTNLFKTPVNDIFRIAMVSDGNGNIRRQRLRDGSEFSVDLDTYAVKIGEDFHRFLAGRVNWADLMVLIGESFKRDLTARIAKAVMDSFQQYNATYHFTSTAVPTEDELVMLASHIEARTGEKVAIYGTKLAIRRIAPSKITEAMNGSYNSVGYYGEIAGIQIHEIAQAHNYGDGVTANDTFAVDNNFILLLPQNVDKMVKIVNEGDAIIQDQQEGQTADMMKEYFIAIRFGISVITSKAFGFVKFGGTQI